MKDKFLALVRIGIGHPCEFSLDGIDWDEVEALAKQQGLLGIVFDAVERLKSNTDCTDNLPPLTTWLRWIGEVMQGYEARYALYSKAINDLVLKGYACALNWPIPEHRPCGDIDIFLFGKYKEADEILSRELEIKIDHSHQHHTVFEWQGFTVENHYVFVNVVVHRSSRELEKIFKSLAHTDNTFYCHTDITDICLPSANLHALFLIRHMVSHFTAVGISLRQVLDWGFFVKSYGKEVDWGWLIKVLEKYHMREFFDCVNTICVEDLGFDCLPIPAYSIQLKERILNDIIEPEFNEVSPRSIWKRVPFKYRRWKANQWKRELCYDDGQLRTFLGGVWNHLLKPAGI